MAGRRLIMGDLHGSLKALVEVLDKAAYNKDEDTLFFTGDLSDGYPEVYECLRLLMTFPLFRPVIGNHDVWLQNWLMGDTFPMEWVTLGGKATLKNFNVAGVTIEEKRKLGRYLATWPYVIEERDCFIMHGGPGSNLTDEDLRALAKVKRKEIDPYADSWDERLATPEGTVLWDRMVFRCAQYDEKLPPAERPRKEVKTTKRLFIGHTEISDHKPFISEGYNLINVDTACGSYGCLTIMDMDSLEFWQSSPSMELYGFCSIQM